MGMTDQATEGVWRFQDGSTVNFTKWAPPDEPNGGEKENCATFFGDTAKLGLYNDGPCTYRYNAYVCKKDAVAGRFMVIKYYKIHHSTLLDEFTSLHSTHHHTTSYHTTP